MFMTKTHTHSLSRVQHLNFCLLICGSCWFALPELWFKTTDSARESSVEKVYTAGTSSHYRHFVPVLYRKGSPKFCPIFLQAFSSVPVGEGKDRCCSQFPLTHRKRERWLERMRMIELNYETVQNKTEIWYKSLNLWFFSARMGWRAEMSFTSTAWPKLWHLEQPCHFRCLKGKCLCEIKHMAALLFNVI